MSKMKLNKELGKVERLAYAGYFDEAELKCLEFSKRHPEDLSVLFVHSGILRQRGKFSEALSKLKEYLTYFPNDRSVRKKYINFLCDCSLFEQALSANEYFKNIEHKVYYSNLGSICLQMGRYKEASRALKRLIQLRQGDSNPYIRYGDVLKMMGRTGDAIASYRQAIEIEPGSGVGFWHLSNLKSYTFQDSEIESIRRLIKNRRCSPEDQMYLCFSLAKGLEDTGEYSESFRYYEMANKIKNGKEPHYPEDSDNLFKALAETCDLDFFADRSEFGSKDKDPIFIVGMPRSGSTLVEQILASHSQVDGTRELSDMLDFAQRMSGDAMRYDSHATRYPESLKNLSLKESISLGKKYLDLTQVQRGKALYFVDKMPNNFIMIGLIRLILPNAKVIDARRHPMSVGFSCFRQLFPGGLRFSNSLYDTGLYYRAYVTLMEHWNKAIPGFVHRVQYENMVTDTEVEVRKLLDFCGLVFEAECLEFYKNKRAVKSPSAQQVRQPIYTHTVEQWKNYEQYLEPLKLGLGYALDGYVE